VEDAAWGGLRRMGTDSVRAFLGKYAVRVGTLGDGFSLGQVLKIGEGMQMANLIEKEKDNLDTIVTFQRFFFHEALEGLKIHTDATEDLRAIEAFAGTFPSVPSLLLKPIDRLDLLEIDSSLDGTYCKQVLMDALFLKAIVSENGTPLVSDSAKKKASRSTSNKAKHHCKLLVDAAVQRGECTMQVRMAIRTSRILQPRYHALKFLSSEFVERETQLHAIPGAAENLGRAGRCLEEVIAWTEETTGALMANRSTSELNDIARGVEFAVTLKKDLEGDVLDVVLKFDEQFQFVSGLASKLLGAKDRLLALWSKIAEADGLARGGDLASLISNLEDKISEGDMIFLLVLGFAIKLAAANETEEQRRSDINPHSPTIHLECDVFRLK
jgi:hypothetical protein